MVSFVHFDRAGAQRRDRSRLGKKVSKDRARCMRFSRHVSLEISTQNHFFLQTHQALLLEKLSFHEHQHGTRGRQEGDFRPFQPASLAGRISFTSRAPLLWNMLPSEVQT